MKLSWWRGRKPKWALHNAQERDEIGCLTNVHKEELCILRESGCVIHKPSRHHMRGWPLHWRNDRSIFERICPHGIGHPDPDQLEFWRLCGEDHKGVHGCCGCCQA